MTTREAEQFKELTTQFFQLKPSRISEKLLQAVKKLADIYVSPSENYPKLYKRLDGINMAIEALRVEPSSYINPLQNLLHDLKEDYGFEELELRVHQFRPDPIDIKYEISHRYYKQSSTCITHTVYYNLDRQTLCYTGWHDDGIEYVCSHMVTYDQLLATIMEYRTT